MTNAERPPEPRAIDVTDVDQLRSLAAELDVEPAEIAEAVAQVGPNRTAVELWLAAPAP